VVAISDVIECIVVDTSYLLDLFRIPGHSDPRRSEIAARRLDAAIVRRARLFLPVPVLFEVGNFVAQIADREVLDLQARRLLTLFDLAAKGLPWIVPLASDDEVWTRRHLHDCVTRFVAAQETPDVGLTDAAVIFEADRLKANRLWPRRVHIWTNEHAMKAREPDPEPAR
jgi:predicted nucleic acid-binding protein